MVIPSPPIARRQCRLSAAQSELGVHSVYERLPRDFDLSPHRTRYPRLSLSVHPPVIFSLHLLSFFPRSAKDKEGQRGETGERRA